MMIKQAARVFILIGILFGGTCLAQKKDGTVREIMRGVSNSFSLPLRDLLKKEHESEWRNLFVGFSGNFSYGYPLKRVPGEAGADGVNSQGSRALSNQTLTASVKYNPISYWFASATFYRYVNSGLQKSWNPDFSYVIGYDDWHPWTLGFLYSHYGGNRLKPDRSRGETVSDLEEGGLSLSWKYVLPRWLEEQLLVHESGGIGASIAYNTVPKYMNLATLEERDWKRNLGFSFKYGIYKWVYFSFTAYYYPLPEHQQPWDPDYTYGFGYFDWHPGTITVQYNNYSGNRYPWRKGSNFKKNFKEGSLSISWSWAW